MTTASDNSRIDYLLKHHEEQILKVLKSSKSGRKSIQINLTTLSKETQVGSGQLFKLLTGRDHDKEDAKWKAALRNVVQQLISRESLRCENTNLAIEYFQHPEACWPRIERKDLWKVVEFQGYVYRMSSSTKMEHLRKISCSKCKKETIVKGNRVLNYEFESLKKCTLTASCPGYMRFDNTGERVPEHTTDFQEMKVQQIGRTSNKREMLVVQAEGHLVNCCYIGDTVRILGILEFRMSQHSTSIQKFVVRALNIKKESLELKLILEPEQMSQFINTWNEDRFRLNNSEINARNELLKAVAPELDGCYALKLALILTLCSGGGKKERASPRGLTQCEIQDRECVHLMFAGIPGIGKSQLIKAAMKISVRATKTTGHGATKAGLTASYFKENGEYHVEGGALVQANNGVCCIDEFNHMPCSVREVMHEAMEQQKFMLVKAAINIEVYSKCSVIGTMNHKQRYFAKDAQAESVDELKILNMEGSLASRFDLIFVLESAGPDHDIKVMNFILDTVNRSEKRIMEDKTNGLWDLKRLQLHVICSRGIQVEVSPEVQEIINQYFLFCQACEGINTSRKTVRLKDSLRRLSVSHAKVLLRKRTKIIDVCTVIWLMENSWTFGYLIEPENLVESQLPVGPSNECIAYMLEALDLAYLTNVFEEEERATMNDSLKAVDSNKFFGQTSNMKKSFNENLELPEQLQKSFAIATIDDLFAHDISDKEEEMGDAAGMNFGSFAPLPAQTSTQYTQGKSMFKKPPPKRSTESNEAENVKKPKRTDDGIEDDLGAFNLLFGTQSNARPKTLFSSLASKDAECLRERPIEENCVQNNQESSTSDKLKRFSYISQDAHDITGSSGYGASDGEKKSNQNDEWNMDDFDPETFNPYD